MLELGTGVSRLSVGLRVQGNAAHACLFGDKKRATFEDIRLCNPKPETLEPESSFLFIFHYPFVKPHISFKPLYTFGNKYVAKSYSGHDTHGHGRLCSLSLHRVCDVQGRRLTLSPNVDP